MKNLTIIIIVINLLFILPVYSKSNFSESRDFKSFINKFYLLKDVENIYPGYNPFTQPIVLINSTNNLDEFVLINNGEIVLTTSNKISDNSNLILYSYYYPKAKKMGISYKLPNIIETYLEKNNISRAFIFKYNFDPKILEQITENNTNFFDSISILKLSYIIHEGFHLHITLPRWIEKTNKDLWPKWDIQPNREKLKKQCYQGSETINKLYEEELDAIIKAFEYSNFENVENEDIFRDYIKEFISKRNIRYSLTNQTNVSNIESYSMNCEEAESRYY